MASVREQDQDQRDLGQNFLPSWITSGDKLALNGTDNAKPSAVKMIGRVSKLREIALLSNE